MKKFIEVNIKGGLNINSEAPVVLSLTIGKIAKMGQNQGDHDNSVIEDDIVDTTEKKLSIGIMVKMCCGLIKEEVKLVYIYNRIRDHDS